MLLEQVYTKESRCYRGEHKLARTTIQWSNNQRIDCIHALHSLLLNADNDIVYANINSNTACIVREAKQLIDNGIVEHAIVIAEERPVSIQYEYSMKHQINVTPGEGFALIVVSKEGNGVPLLDAKWEYSYNRNPFLVDTVGYQKVKCEADIVKGHQTGTEQNDNAEKEVFGAVVGYKDKIDTAKVLVGWIELCMVLMMIS